MMIFKHGLYSLLEVSGWVCCVLVFDVCSYESLLLRMGEKCPLACSLFTVNNEKGCRCDVDDEVDCIYIYIISHTTLLHPRHLFEIYLIYHKFVDVDYLFLLYFLLEVDKGRRFFQFNPKY